MGQHYAKYSKCSPAQVSNAAHYSLSKYTLVDLFGLALVLLLLEISWTSAVTAVLRRSLSLDFRFQSLSASIYSSSKKILGCHQINQNFTLLILAECGATVKTTKHFSHSARPRFKFKTPSWMIALFSRTVFCFEGNNNVSLLFW